METKCEKEHKYDMNIYSNCPVCYPGIKCPNCGHTLAGGNSCPHCMRIFQFQFIPNRSCLLEVSNLHTSLGVAPDGLPWVISIHRGGKDNQDFSTILEEIKNLTKTILTKKMPILTCYNPEGITGAINTFISQISQEMIHLQIRDVLLTDKTKVRCFVTKNPVDAFVGKPFLDEMLKGRETTLVSPATERRAITTASSISDEKQISKFRQIQEEMKYTKHLLLELNNDKVYVGNTKREDFEKISFLRDFTYESLLGLKEIWAVIDCAGQRKILPHINLKDQDIYLKEMSKAHLQKGHIKYFFKKHEIGELLTKLARQLGEMHKAGKVHGDLKPQNILLTNQGFAPFDSQNVSIGELSYAHTLEWTSPEQIIGEKVSPASDIYSLALIWLRCLGGVMYGEETTYSLPVFRKDGEEYRRVKILKDPRIYIPAKEGQAVEWQGEWQNFFKACLAFDPEKRISDGNTFAALMEEKLLHYPIPGDGSISPYWGKLGLYCFKQTRLSPGWEVNDH